MKELQLPDATATTIIRQSEIFTPKITKAKSLVEIEERRHIKFHREYSNNEQVTKIFSKVVEQKERKLSDLRVIFDEHSNVVIDDEESKRKRKKALILYRRSIAEVGDNVTSDIDTDSISSERSITKFVSRLLKDFMGTDIPNQKFHSIKILILRELTKI